MRYARSIGITLVAGISLICSSAALADRGRGGHDGRHGFSMGHHGGHGGFRGHRGRGHHGFSRHRFGHHGFNRHRFGHRFGPHRFRHHGFNRSSIFIGFGGFGHWPSYAYGYGYPLGYYGQPYGYGGYYGRCWTEWLWDPYAGVEVPVRRCRY